MTTDKTVRRLRGDARALREWSVDAEALSGCADGNEVEQEAETVDDKATRIELWSIVDRLPPE